MTFLMKTKPPRKGNTLNLNGTRYKVVWCRKSPERINYWHIEIQAVRGKKK